MIEEFHFIRPWFLLVLPTGLLLTYLLWKGASANSNWREICDPHLIKHLLVGRQLKNSGLPYSGMAIGWALAALAMAGPTWQRLPQPAHDVLEGRVIVFDLSLSMDSSDVQPTRLSRARYKLADLILAGEGLQQGLVVFAGDAFVVAPLTDDIGTLINLTPSLNTATLPVQGSRADLGLEFASMLLGNTSLLHGDIILITDGVTSTTKTVAGNIASQGHKISVLAVGTKDGGPVRLSSGELLKDDSGNIVIPGVDHNMLQQVADAGGGRYVNMSSDNTDIERLVQLDLGSLEFNLNQGASLDTDINKFKSDQWKDFGPILILPLLIIVALGFRRGWILSVAIFLNPLISEPVYAFGWNDFWLRSDQQAQKYFEDESYDLIQENAPFDWQGAARYRSKDYHGAIGAYSIDDAENAIAHYNRGNALVRARALDESIAAYNRALEIDPSFEDANFNKALVGKLLRQQEDSPALPGNNEEQTEGEENIEFMDQSEGQRPDEQNQNNSGQGGNSERSENTQSKNYNSDEKSSSSSLDDDYHEEEDQNNTGENETIQKLAKAQQDAADTSDLPMSEQQQAMEQILQRIPDDPGGLLRRKFLYQYLLRPRQNHSEGW